MLRLVLAVLALIAILVPARAEPKGKDPFVSVHAEYFFRNSYRGLGNHKALAVSSYGGYGYSYGFPSKEAARQSALDFCKQVLKRDYPKEMEALTCVVFASGDEVLEPELVIGPELGIAPDGKDRPLNKGMSVNHFGKERKGILVFVHGCDGAIGKDYGHFLGGFFAASGFDFYAPDSFTEKRPGQICGTADRTERLGARAIDSTRIIKLRVAQTLRTIATLKKRFPGVPIYVWGQSEGGFVVQMLGAEVAGIIVSGEECGIDGKMIAAPRKTPVLFMFGRHDPFIDGYKQPLSETETIRCLSAARNPNSKVTIIDNAGHGLFPWRRQVAKALLDFMGGGEPPLIPRARPGSVKLNGAQRKAFKDYAKRKPHRAFAVGPKGFYGWAEGWEYAEDAELAALYYCSSRQGEYYFASKPRSCALVDIDGVKAKP